MKKLWFKAKTYGWGWTPATWEGWLILALYGAAMAWFAWQGATYARTDEEFLINFVPRALITTALLIYICYRTGEKPRWRWGKNS